MRLVLQTAREEQEYGKLDNIKTQQPRGLARLKALVPAKQQPQRHIHRGIDSNDREARPERNFQVEAVVHDEHRRGLAEDRKPAQPHQGVETHVAQGLRGLLVEYFGHGRARYQESVIRHQAESRADLLTCLPTADYSP